MQRRILCANEEFHVSCGLCKVSHNKSPLVNDFDVCTVAWIGEEKAKRKSYAFQRTKPLPNTRLLWTIRMPFECCRVHVGNQKPVQSICLSSLCFKSWGKLPLRVKSDRSWLTIHIYIYMWSNVFFFFLMMKHALIVQDNKIRYIIR